jgi:mannose-6-phosphate isomerase-like protein (cupin superfamily)
VQKETVQRPWGTYCVIQEGTGFLVKCITVNPKGKLSLQYHNHRKEHWVILEGQADVIKGEKKLLLKEGQHVDIEIKEIHSIENPYEQEAKVLEVQRGEILIEEDIVRLKDIYGRAD